jgi:site-specific recombinase XerD
MSQELAILGGRDLDAAVPSAARLVIANSGHAAFRRILEFFAAELRNDHTRRAYAHAVGEFLAFAVDRGVPRLQDVDPLTVAAYVERRAGAIPTRKLHLAAVRRFFDYLVTGQIVPVNPATSVRGPAYSVAEGLTPAFDIQQVRTLLGSLDRTTVVGVRDHAIIAILTYTACRVGAIAKLRVKHFAPEGAQWVLRFHEKRGKLRKIPVRHDLQGYLDAYLAAAGIHPEDKDAPLFRTARRKTKTLTDRGMTAKDILRMIKRRLKDAGLPQTFSCHSFRATTITNLLEQGVPLEDVQYLAGHADSRTTKLYSRKKQEVTRNIVERIAI